MDYTVMQSKKDRIILGLCGFATLLLLIFLTWVALTYKVESEDIPLTLAGYGILGAALALLVYGIMRPRIRVSGEKITIYPLWKRKIELNMGDITRRNKDIYTDNSAFIGGVAGYAASQGGAGMTELKITYFAGEKKLITLNTLMTNARKFDAEVGKIIAEREKTNLS